MTIGRRGGLRPGLCRRETEAIAKNRDSPKVKLQVALEALTGEKTPGQIADKYGSTRLPLAPLIPFT